MAQPTPNRLASSILPERAPTRASSVPLPQRGLSTSLIITAGLLLAFAAAILLSRPAHAQEGCIEAACVSTTGRLASVDSEQSELLNPLLALLLGEETALTLDVADYTALAEANVTLGDLLGGLQVELGLGTPQEVLTSTVTLPQLLGVLDDLSPGNSGIAALIPVVAGLADPIVLGDLLQLNLSPDALAETELSVLDLLVGSIQLFNRENLAGVEQLTIPGADLGIANVANVTLSLTVLSPPVIVCGGEGSTFSSAAIRLALDLELADVTLADSGIDLGVLDLTANLEASVANLSLYVDVASGNGTIQTIDAIANSITLQGTPGIASLYLGEIAPGASFFDVDFDPATDLLTGTVASASGFISETVLGEVISYTATVGIRAVAEGTTGPQSATLTGALPLTTTLAASGTSISTLLTTLIANLTLDVEAEATLLAGVFDLDIVEGALESTLGPILESDLFGSGAPVETVLDDLLNDFVAPLLALLGVGLGEMDLTVFGVNGDDDLLACPDLRVTIEQSGNLTLGQPAVFTVTVTNIGGAATTTPISITADLLPGLLFDDSDGSDAGWTRQGTGTEPYTFTHPGPLEPGDDLVLVLNVTPRRLGPVDGSVTGTTTGDDNALNNTAPITATVNPVSPTDADGDGIPDDVECPDGPPCPDTDGDGIPNNEDLDSDDDGIPDNTECPDGPPCPDTDGDGAPDFLDTDSDDDNVPDNIECPSATPCRDTDGDEKPDYIDPNDDGDDVPTEAECPEGPPCPEEGEVGLPDYLNPNYPEEGAVESPDIFLPLVLRQYEGPSNPNANPNAVTP